MRALILFVFLLFVSLVLPAQIRLHQLEKLPVQFHAPGTLYAIGDVVKTSDGLLYRATASTTTTPPGADWESFDVGGSSADGDGILDGGIDTIPAESNFRFYMWPGQTGIFNNRFDFGEEISATEYRTGWGTQDNSGGGFTFRHNVDQNGDHLDAFMGFSDGSITGTYRKDRFFSQGSNAPLGMGIVFESGGVRFQAPIFGGDYIAMPFSGPTASTYGQVRVTDDSGATTWEDYTPPAQISDDQTLSIAGQDLTISNGNTVTLPSGGGSSSTTGTVVNGAAINPNAMWKKVATNAVSGVDFGTNRNNGLSGNTATFRGKYNRTYFAYYKDVNIEVFVNYYDHDTKTFGTPVSWGIPRAGATDNHAYPELTVTPKGHILLVQEELDGTGTSNHNTPHWFRRSTNPEDISSYVEDGPLIVHGSYPNLTVLGDTIHYTQRFSQDLSTDHQVVGYMFSDDDGDNWEKWDGTAVSTSSDSMDVLIDLGANNYWAYSWDLQAEDHLCKVITLANATPNFNYPTSYILYTKDGRTWGNYEWLVGATSGAWSKDVPATSFISLTELNTNALVAGDATIDQDSSNIVYDAVIYNNELHYVWGKGLRGTGNNVWDDFIYTIKRPDGTKDDYSLVAGNALATDVDQLNYGQILASDDNIMVKLLNADDGTVNIVVSNDHAKTWILADTYGTIDSDPVKSVTAHGDRTNIDYSQGVAVFSSSAPSGVQFDIYELVGIGTDVTGGGGGGTDDQTLTLVGTDLSIEDGNTVDLSSIAGTAGADAEYAFFTTTDTDATVTTAHEVNWIASTPNTAGWTITTGTDISPPEDGDYLVTATVGITNSNRSELQIELRKNGTPQSPVVRNYTTRDANQNDGGITLTFPVSLTTSDNFSIAALSVNDTGNGNINPDITSLFVQRLDIADGTGGGGGTADDLGDHTMTQDLIVGANFVRNALASTAKTAFSDGGIQVFNDAGTQYTGLAVDQVVFDGSAVTDKRGLRLDGSENLELMVGAAGVQGVDLPGSQPGANNSVWQTNTDGTGQWAVVSGGGTPSFRGVRAEARSAQTFNTNFTQLNLTYEDFDTDNWFDLTTDRFQPDVAGYYSISGGIVFSALAEGNVAIVELRKNGTRWCILSRGTGSATSGTNLGGYSGSDIVYLNGTTDYIELWGWNGQASDRSIFVSDGYNRFSAHLIGE